NIGQQRRHGIADAQAALRQSARQTARALVGLSPGAALCAVNHRDAARIDVRRALEERQRRERRVVRRILVELLLVGIAFHAVLSIRRQRTPPFASFSMASRYFSWSATSSGRARSTLRLETSTCSAASAAAAAAGVSSSIIRLSWPRVIAR